MYPVVAARQHSRSASQNFLQPISAKLYSAAGSIDTNAVCLFVHGALYILHLPFIHVWVGCVLYVASTLHAPILTLLQILTLVLAMFHGRGGISVVSTAVDLLIDKTPQYREMLQ